MEIINVEKLIQCVKDRPLLYDANLEDYKNTDAKIEAWREIAKIIIGDKWSSMSEVQQLKAEALLQHRWRGLRTGYQRALRVQDERRRKGIVNPKPYVHQDRMSFLNPHLRPSESKSTASKTEDDQSSQTGQSCLFGETKEEELQQKLSSSNDANSAQSDYDTDMSGNFSSPQVQDNLKENESSSPGTGTDEPEMRKTVQILKRKLFENVDVVKVDIQEEDPDRMFLLSLLPYFKRIKVQDQIHAKMKLMQTINAFIP